MHTEEREFVHEGGAGCPEGADGAVNCLGVEQLLAVEELMA